MNLKINKAKSKDVLFFYKLRTSKIVRINSLNKNHFTFEEHQKWYFKNYKKKGNFFFIIENTKNKIGYIRLSELNRANLLLSIAIIKKFKKKGIGTYFINKIEKKFKNKTFVVNVLRKNISSFLFFEKNGYITTRSFTNYFEMKKKLKNSKNYIEIINKISSIRKKNNSHWMDILKLAFRNSPHKAAKIMSQIYKEDNRISKLTKKLK
jgi:ribosomal protein S18 acetylase RimI-like enzyme